jgi:hypothetical protein
LKQAQPVQVPGFASNTRIQTREHKIQTDKYQISKRSNSSVLISIPEKFPIAITKKIRTDQRKSTSVLISILVKVHICSYHTSNHIRTPENPQDGTDK